MAHTPTFLNTLRVGGDLDHPIINDVGTRIAVPVAEIGRGDKRLANVKSIVCACNAHDELVAALKDARATLECLRTSGVNVSMGNMGLIDAALAKAEEK